MFLRRQTRHPLHIPWRCPGRLRQHCRYFLDTIGNDPQPGKKLGFIAQEMGREINTTGSKANHTEIQKIVVKMKDELEKIKEQSLNIL